MKDIQENMRSEFDELWNLIREEDWEPVEDKTEENNDQDDQEINEVDGNK